MLLGNFDGLHRGHAKLLAKGQSLAQQRGAPLAILQCDPHPRLYFSGESRFRVSTGLAQRQLLAQAGVDLIYAPCFDAAFAALSAENFVEHILIEELQVTALVTGRDFRFGHRRRGDVALLQQLAMQFGFGLTVVEDEVADAERISTSAVRAAIARGDIAAATMLLGHAWCTEVEFEKPGLWQFSADQILPPAGVWPVVALDRQGRQLGCHILELSSDGSVTLTVPADTALLSWLPMPLPAPRNPIPLQSRSTDAYA
jgi:riboflavin kinase/FMN adenylyltransferase